MLTGGSWSCVTKTNPHQHDFYHVSVMQNSSRAIDLLPPVCKKATCLSASHETDHKVQTPVWIRHSGWEAHAHAKSHP